MKHLRISSEIVFTVNSMIVVVVIVKVHFFSNRHFLNVNNFFRCNINVV